MHTAPLIRFIVSWVDSTWFLLCTTCARHWGYNGKPESWTHRTYALACGKSRANRDFAACKTGLKSLFCYLSHNSVFSITNGNSNTCLLGHCEIWEKTYTKTSSSLPTWTLASFESVSANSFQSISFFLYPLSYFLSSYWDYYQLVGWSASSFSFLHSWIPSFITSSNCFLWDITGI